MVSWLMPLCVFAQRNVITSVVSGASRLGVALHNELWG